MDNSNLPVNNQNLLEKAKKIIYGPRVIFVILGIIFLAEIVYVLKFMIFSASSPTPLPPSPAPAAQINTQPKPAGISINASKTNFKVNEVVPVSIIVDTGGYTVDGVDLILRFDPKILEATEEGLTKGTILGEYPLKSLDANKGMVYISGVSNTKGGFTGIGQFALINFKAKLPGKASLTVDFIKKSATTDSNLVEMGTSKDILESVNNLDLTVQ
ncbi:hypothetical protein HYU95_00480 [Candidatus Daviesbacteria bacterium]|nr:hypothetical protein [Candidatus Daviesbacteria bacterium]